MSQTTYLSNKARLLKDFDKSLARLRKGLVARCGEAEAASLIGEARHWYEEIIPQIPYIGKGNPFLIFLLPATRYLAVYRAFQEHGWSLEEIGRLVYALGESEFKELPGWMRHLIGILWFSPWLTVRIRKRALSSHDRIYPGDYVLDYVTAGPGFDWGVDYVECASCKFLDDQDAPELKPFVCAVDKIASEMLGWGLKRTKTLAEGGDRCDFRFKKGGQTNVSIPQSLL